MAGGVEPSGGVGPDEPSTLEKKGRARSGEVSPRMEYLEAALLAGEEAEARCREPAQMGAVGKDDRDPAAPDAPKTHAADAAEVHADAGEAEDAARPVSTSDAGCGAIVAEQGIGPWSHLEGARGGEAPIQEEAEVAGPGGGGTP